MTEYVRLTFHPAGGKRKRTTWAEIASTKNGRVSFWACNRDGDRPVPNELIICAGGEVTVQPAVMSRYYVMLMLPDDALLRNDVDAKWICPIPS